MSKIATINALDEALRLHWLENSQQGDPVFSEKELKMILTAPDTFDMKEDRKIALIDKLYENVKTQSLGELVTDRISAKNLRIERLAADTKLPVEMLKEVQTDKVFPNNIPVMLLKGLLRKLEISIAPAKTAIVKTFESLKRSEMMDIATQSAQVSFRRKNQDSRNFYVKKGSKSDGRELYENKDALDKYISRLEELMAAE